MNDNLHEVEAIIGFRSIRGKVFAILIIFIFFKPLKTQFVSVQFGSITFDSHGFTPIHT